MYWFKETERAKVLQGRTVKYLAEEKICCGYTYLAGILKGKKGCSRRMAKDITNCISFSAKIEDYFEIRER